MTTSEWVMATLAGLTFLMLYTSTIVGAAFWLMSKLKELKQEILDDFGAKHEANEKNVKALQELVLRHDIMLDPEFNGTGKIHPRRSPP